MYEGGFTNHAQHQIQHTSFVICHMAKVASEVDMSHSHVTCLWFAILQLCTNLLAPPGALGVVAV